jgi:hypothetical protein
MSAPIPLEARRVARSAVTLHVRPDGSVSGRGLADTPDDAFPTIQHAVNSLMWEWDLRGRIAKIKVADGVYTDGVSIRGVPVGSTSRPSIMIEGNVSSPSNCLMDVANGHAFENWGGHVELSGFKFRTTNGASIFGHASGQTLIGTVEFGQSAAEHILAADNHFIRHRRDYKISGGATIHVHVADGASYGNGRAVTLVGKPHFRDEFHGLNFAKSLWTGTKFIGVATGMRHVVHFNSVCAIGGVDPSVFFPGDLPGIVSDFSTMA